jgi:hypothetical protein
MDEERAGGHGAPRKSRRRRLGVSGGLGAPPKWTPSADDWNRLAAVYGNLPFNDELRAEIAKAVDEYFNWATYEPKAPFADEFIEKLHNAKRLARELSEAISALGDARHLIAPHWSRYFPREDCEDSEDAPIEEDLDTLFDRLAAETPRRRGRDHRDFEEVVHTICSALDDTMRHVSSEDAGEFAEGDAWRQLIVDLARALEARGFKISASKDLSKGRPSRFVRFVRELQPMFPEELRRHVNLDALSGAISEVLQLLKPKKQKLHQRLNRNGRLSRAKRPR